MLWRIFKFLLSMVCFLFATLLAVFGTKSNPAFEMYIAAGVFVFFAAILWIDTTKPSRALGLAGMVVSFGIFMLAFSEATGHDLYPKQCHGRGILICELENLLFAVGGYPAAAIPGFLFAIFVFNLSLTTFNRARRSNT